MNFDLSLLYKEPFHNNLACFWIPTYKFEACLRQVWPYIFKLFYYHSNICAILNYSFTIFIRLRFLIGVWGLDHHHQIAHVECKCTKLITRSTSMYLLILIRFNCLFTEILKQNHINSEIFHLSNISSTLIISDFKEGCWVDRVINCRLP